MIRCHCASLSIARFNSVLLFLATVLTLPSVSLNLMAQTSYGPPLMAINRVLPPTSLRGELRIIQVQSGEVNGKIETLAPGLRVRGMNNMMLSLGNLLGKKLVVNYQRDSYGLITEAWVLRDDERKKLWPKTPAEAARWDYDPYTQSWKKP